MKVYEGSAVTVDVQDSVVRFLVEVPRMWTMDCLPRVLPLPWSVSDAVSQRRTRNSQRSPPRHRPLLFVYG